MISFELEILPIAKGRPRFWNGRAVTPEKTRTFEKILELAAQRQKPATPMQGPLVVSVDFTFVKPRSVKRNHPSARPDLDNLTKGVLDALNGIYWIDDAQIVKLNLEKYYGDRNFIKVTASEIR